MMTAHLRLALVSVVVDRWSNIFFVILLLFRALCNVIIDY
jgi:hypothetical protein